MGDGSREVKGTCRAVIWSRRGGGGGGGCLGEAWASRSLHSVSVPTKVLKEAKGSSFGLGIGDYW